MGGWVKEGGCVEEGDIHAPVRFSSSWSPSSKLVRPSKSCSLVTFKAEHILLPSLRAQSLPHKQNELGGRGVFEVFLNENTMHVRLATQRPETDDGFKTR